MESLQLWLHIANMILFVFAGVVWASVPIVLIKKHIDPTFAKLGMLTAVFAITLVLVFILLQMDWILSEHNAAVGNLTSYLWLIWDYNLAIFLIILGMWSIVNIQLVQFKDVQSEHIYNEHSR